MNKDISVVFDSKGNTASIFEPANIVVFSKKEGQWIVEKEIHSQINEKNDFENVRSYIGNLIEKLGKCKIIVGSSITGVPYNMLDRAGFAICEVGCISQGVLDNILANINEAYDVNPGNGNEKDKVSLYPVKTDIDGNYFLDFKKLQRVNQSVSSKKAILPFLKNNSFFQLDVIFGHIPLWLEEELVKLNLLSDITKMSANEYKVTIHHKICKS